MKIMLKMKCSIEVFLIILELWRVKSSQTPPHIIFIYADDLGWNDVSFHGSPEIPTPNIDALAMNGILLNNYYGLWLCTPSRAAFLTGKYPIRFGLQHFVLRSGEASGLPLDAVTLPQHLKRLGYANHMVGKWHLGYMTKAYTPTHRGFDSFFGYYNGNLDYFDYTKYGDTGLDKVPYFYGIDLHNGTDIIKNFRGRYATEVFTERAEEIIRQHDPSKPLFLYLAHLAVHSANKYMPHQAPPKYVDRVKYIQDLDRRIHAGTMVALDDSVGQVFKALQEKGMLENSIVAFISDNGGETQRENDGVSSNFPLRGKKYTLWEGGNRLPAVIWSPRFNLQEPRITMQLMHVTDWLPTFYAAAGGNLRDLGDIDGINMWEALTYDLPSPRKELLYNIDPVLGVSALRVGDMKVINGSNGYDSWYNPSEYNCFADYQKKHSCDFENKSLVLRILIRLGKSIVKNPDKWRQNAIVLCAQPPPTEGCNPAQKPCLFNITNDPCEYHDLASRYPEIVDSLMESIYAYKRISVKPQSKKSDPRANPACHGFAHVPWLEPEHYTECNTYL